MTIVLQRPVQGSQAPLHQLVPAYVDNEWLEAIELITAYSGAPDVWQTLPLEAWFGRRANGLWSSTKNGMSCPRQNGKNYDLEARELYGMVVLKERILHTAHEVRTSKAHFKRMCKYFEDVPDLKKMVKSISKTNGEEAIYLLNGAELRFVSRSKRAARGFSSDLLVIDEAQELDSESYEAILPIISASPNPQQILTGTPPGPKVPGEVFTKMRTNGVENKTDRLSWFEWSADKDADLDDEQSWAQANPGYPHRISRETIEDERSSFVDDDSFARERLGIWADLNSSGVINMDTFAALAEQGQMQDPVVFAVDVNPDRTHASISVAGFIRSPHFETGEFIDKTRVNVVDSQAGIGWIVNRLKVLTETHTNIGVVIDSNSQAGSLLVDLKRARIKVVEVSFVEHSRACGDFLASINDDGTLSHANQLALTAACATAQKRYSNEKWLWSRKDVEADITPLVSASLAAYVLSVKRTPKSAAPNRRPQEPMMFL